jgi:hypothetical protein
MNFTNFAYLCLAIALVFYFMGAGPLVQVNMGGYAGGSAGTGFLKLSCPADTVAYGTINTTGTYTNEASKCNDTFFTQLVIVLIVGGLGIGIGMLLGFSAMFVIPVVLAWAFINLFVFPFSFLLDPAFPAEVVIPVTAFLNVLTGLALLNFIRGPT